MLDAVQTQSLVQLLTSVCFLWKGALTRQHHIDILYRSWFILIYYKSNLICTSQPIPEHKDNKFQSYSYKPLKQF